MSSESEELTDEEFKAMFPGRWTPKLQMLSLAHVTYSKHGGVWHRLNPWPFTRPAPSNRFPFEDELREREFWEHARAAFEGALEGED